MTLWSELFRVRHLLSRTFYSAPGTQVIVAPDKAAIIRASLSAAGGWANGGFGAGAAFARVKAVCAPGDQFSIQVGDIAHSLGAGDALGDSILTKLPSNTVLAKAARGGGGNSPGLAANCVGDTKRSGANPGNTAPDGSMAGGLSAGDDADPYPLSFGGRGASHRIAAAPGGGGAKNYVEYQNGGYQQIWTLCPGNGLICVEFFDQDPGYP